MRITTILLLLLLIISCDKENANEGITNLTLEEQEVLRNFYLKRLIKVGYYEADNFDQTELDKDINEYIKVEDSQLVNLEVAGICKSEFELSVLLNSSKQKHIGVDLPLCYSNEDLLELKRFNKVESLILSNFDTIPSVFLDLNLKSLIISNDHTRGKMSLKGIENFDRLSKLTVSVNTTTPTIPSEVYQIKSLRELTLFSPLERTLSSDIGDFEQLEKLTLHTDSLEKLPETIGDLRELKSLTIRKSLIRELPSSLIKLKKMNDLTIHGILDEFPNCVKEMKKLKYLEIFDVENYHNSITSVPDYIGNNSQLEFLELEADSLFYISREIGKTNLMFFKIYGGTKELTFPDELSKLPIEYLEIKYSKLTKTPTFIYQLRKIKKITLLGARITEFIGPKDISTWKHLEYLNLSGNLISSLPKDLGECRKLKWLDISYNRLKTLPKSIGNLSDINITWFANPWESLPEEVCNNVKDFTGSNRLNLPPVECK